MIVRGGTGIGEVVRLCLWRNRVAVLAVVVLEFAAWGFHEVRPDIEVTTSFSWAIFHRWTVSDRSNSDCQFWKND